MGFDFQGEPVGPIKMSQGAPRQACTPTGGAQAQADQVKERKTVHADPRDAPGLPAHWDAAVNAVASSAHSSFWQAPDLAHAAANAATTPARRDRSRRPITGAS